ncbi:RNA polymerase subunit sigma-70 [Pengzhenrongella phosphoraccumulans]|uniref:RNA polymerase subunit sigma-70 n=1 Tax=Pengzhenrongella phosphoraccumulans TaxID=3114394 RepID=UPI00388E6753
MSEPEPTPLQAASDGKDRAFAELVVPYERELRVHCYRILGSMHAADDALQETLIAAWGALPKFEGRSSVRTWLYRIATSRCLNAIRDGARRPPLAPVAPFDPPSPTTRERVTWIQPYAEHLLPGDDPAALAVARDGIELAFVTALQTLPPRPTAALVLCDVLGFGVGEVASMLDVNPTAVKGLLQRARAGMPAGPPSASAQKELVVARQLADAFCRDDVAAILTLLTDTAWLAMPPAPHRYDGHAAIGAFLSASAAGRGQVPYELVPVCAGGHAAFGCYLAGRARGLLVVTAHPDGNQITSLVRLLDDDVHTWFDLPTHLPPRAREVVALKGPRQQVQPSSAEPTKTW